MRTSTPFHQVELVFLDCHDDNHNFLIPIDATIVAVEFRDVGGLSHARAPYGVWVAMPVDEP